MTPEERSYLQDIDGCITKILTYTGRDRAIENLIGAAGVGIGTSSAAASSWAGQTARPVATFGLSLGLEIASSLLIYGLLRMWRH